MGGQVNCHHKLADSVLRLQNIRDFEERLEATRNVLDVIKRRPKLLR